MSSSLCRSENHTTLYVLLLGTTKTPLVLHSAMHTHTHTGQTLTQSSQIKRCETVGILWEAPYSMPIDRQFAAT